MARYNLALFVVGESVEAALIKCPLVEFEC